VAYYDALRAGWNSATQPPTGVVGTGLTGGMSTAQKIAAINSWTLTSTIPAQYTITGAEIASCIKWSEFAALTAAQQTQVLALCAIPGPLSVGSNAAEIALLIDGMIIAYFPSGGATITALSALAPGAQNWVTSQSGAGLSGPVSLADTQAAGLS
jgi:hypothetical protein